LGFDEETVSTVDLTIILKHMSGCENVSTENKERWFEVGCVILGYEELSIASCQLKQMKMRMEKHC
jgi:hypothetical protein